MWSSSAAVSCVRICGSIPRFADNPLVTGPPHVRFYSGYGTRNTARRRSAPPGRLDTAPRNLTEFQREALTLLAQQIVDQLELRMAYRDLTVLRTQEREFEKRLRAERMNEAQRLAAELHDDVAQDLVGIALLLGALRRTPAAQSESVREPLRKRFTATEQRNRALSPAGSGLWRIYGAYARSH